MNSKLRPQIPYFQEERNLKFELAGLANSGQMVWNRDGIPFDEALDRLENGRIADIETPLFEVTE